MSEHEAEVESAQSVASAAPSVAATTFGPSFARGYVTPFWQLMQGQTGQDDESPLGSVVPSTVAGTAGALGRESLVQTQASRAYAAGLAAPHVDYDGPLIRSVPTGRWQDYVNHLFTDQGGGRYNAPGNRLLYGSPTVGENIAEMQAYAKPGQPAMANQTQVELNYRAQNNPSTGRGGVADVSSHLDSLGLTRSALTEPKGGGGAHRTWLSRLTGEDPYLHTRALGQGVIDSGASGMRVPSATGGHQVNPIPVNADPSQLQYRNHVDFDAHGAPGPTQVDPAHVSQHGTGGTGRGVMPDGHAPIPAKNRLHLAHPEHTPAELSSGRTRRAGSPRYAAAGAGLMSVGTDLYDHFVDGKDVGAGDIAAHAAGSSGVASLGALANDRVLTPRLGGGLRGAMKGGAIIDAVTSGAFSTWDNASAYREGRETASQATANVLVDTGVGVGAGLAGAAAGAAIGSVIPVAGTAVGAGIGFLAGTAGSYLTRKLADGSGFTDWAKRGMGGALNRFEQPLGRAWDGISSTTQAIGNTASRALGSAGQGLSSAGSAIRGGANRLWNAITPW